MKTQRKRTVMAVDDDEINLMIVIKGAQEAGFAVKPFMASKEAWEYLKSNPQSVDIVMLDKMMPGMTGIEMLKQIKMHKALRHLPVILQTGDAGVAQMREALENGAYYYLTKPFHPDILKAILHSAESECDLRDHLLKQMEADQTRFLALMQEAEFTLQTHTQAHSFAAAISKLASYPELAAMGVTELLTNAIEHGNLEIGFEKKAQCLWSHSWVQELARRAESMEYGKRAVHVHVQRTSGGIQLAIRDEGPGFDWQRMLYDDERRFKLNEPNGRGITKALFMLHDVKFLGKGNEVRCSLGSAEALQPQASPNESRLSS